MARESRTYEYTADDVSYQVVLHFGTYDWHPDWGPSIDLDFQDATHMPGDVIPEFMRWLKAAHAEARRLTPDGT